MSSGPSPDRIVLVAGTRPEVIKLVAVLRALEARVEFEPLFVLVVYVFAPHSL